MSRLKNITRNVTGTPFVVDMQGMPSGGTIKVIPGSGNTSRVEYSITPSAAANPGSSNWSTWPSGDVTTTTEDVLTGAVTALRFTRVSGSSTDVIEVAV